MFLELSNLCAVLQESSPSPSNQSSKPSLATKYLSLQSQGGEEGLTHTWRGDLSFGESRIPIQASKELPSEETQPWGQKVLSPWPAPGHGWHCHPSLCPGRHSSAWSPAGNRFYDCSPSSRTSGIPGWFSPPWGSRMELGEKERRADGSGVVLLRC